MRVFKAALPDRPTGGIVSGGLLFFRAMRSGGFIAAVLLLSSPAAAQTTVVAGTTLTGTNVWDPTGSPYVLGGVVTLAAGATLSIRPSTIVEGGVLVIEGGLVARGDANGTVFLNDTDVRVQPAGSATIAVADLTRSAITVTGASLVIDEVSSDDALFSAVRARGANLVIDRLVLTNQRGGGIDAGGGNLILRNSDLLVLDDRALSIANVESATIDRTVLHTQSGIVNGVVSFYASCFDSVCALNVDHATIVGHIDMQGAFDDVAMTNSIVHGWISGLATYVRQGVAQVSHNLQHVQGAGGPIDVTPIGNTIVERPLFVDIARHDLRITSRSGARFAALGGSDIGAIPFDGTPTVDLVGHVHEDETLAAGSTHALVGDLIVEPGVTLTLEEGTQLQLASRPGPNDRLGAGEDRNKIEVVVHGRLLSRGTTMNRVSIVGFPTDLMSIWLTSGSGPHELRSTTILAGRTAALITDAEDTLLADVRISPSTLGAGLWVRGGNTLFETGVIADARDGVLVQGGALTMGGVLFGGNDVGVRAVSGTVALDRVTIVDGIDGVVANGGELTLTRSILHGHVGVAVDHASGSAPRLDRNLMWRNDQDYRGVSAGVNDLAAPALFVAPVDRDYRLSATSPARQSRGAEDYLGAFPYDGAPALGLLGYLYDDLRIDESLEVDGDITVMPGTRLELADGGALAFGDDAMETGEDPTRSGLVVLGTFTADGDPAAPLRLGTIDDEAWAGIDVLDGGTLSVSNATIARAHVAIHVAGGTARIRRTTLAAYSSRGLHVESGTVSVASSRIETGAGIALLVDGGNVEMTNSIVHLNLAAVFARGGRTTVDHSAFHACDRCFVAEDGALLSVRNSVLDRCRGGFEIFGRPVIAVAYNALHMTGSSYPPGDGSIFEAPAFVDPVRGDFHIGLDSPLVDAADPSGTLILDADGAARPQIGRSGSARSDIGPYEVGADTRTGPTADAGPDQTNEVFAPVEFSARGSTPGGDTPIVEYEWDFGDGSEGIGEVVTYAFAEAGNFEVTLRIRDALGREALDQTTVTVALPGEIIVDPPPAGDEEGCSCTSAATPKAARFAWCWFLLVPLLLRRRRQFGLSLLAALAACTGDDPTIFERPPPPVAPPRGAGLVVEPARIDETGTVTVRFALERKPDALDVRVNDAPATCALREVPVGVGYACAYEMTGEEIEAGTEEVVPVIVRADDRIAIEGSVVFDFQDPEIAEANMKVSAPNGHTSMFSATEGAFVRVVFVVSEPLVRSPVLTTSPEGLPYAEEAALDLRYTFTRVVGSEPEGFYRTLFELEDVAGNLVQIDPPILGSLLLDRTPPETAGAFTFIRQPHGDGAPRAEVRGSLDSTTVVITADPAGEIELGRVVGTGEFTTELPTEAAELPIVYVTQIDDAGNRLGPTPVDLVRLVARFDEEAPHRVATTPEPVDVEQIAPALLDPIAPTKLVAADDDLVRAQSEWTFRRKSAGPGPGARFGHAFGFDGARVLMFGGRANGLDGHFDDTWAYDGGWRSVDALGARPPRRLDHAMAYDPVRDVTVLFGGAGPSGRYGDTWEHDGRTWRRIFTRVAPAPRSGHAMAYDPNRRSVVLFGGLAGRHQNDVWTYDSGGWQQISVAGAPPAPRSGAAMTFDPVEGGMLIFGGEDPTERADTHVLRGGRWERLASRGPMPQVRAVLGHSSTLGQTVLCGEDGVHVWTGGGWSRSHATGPSCGGGELIDRPGDGTVRTVAFSDWEMVFAVIGADGWWFETEDGPTPLPRTGALLAYDTARDRLVLHGGQRTPFAGVEAVEILDDTWEHDGTRWWRVAAGGPAAVDGRNMVYDPTGRRTVLVDGAGATHVYNGSGWRALAATAPHRSGAALAYDPPTGRVVRFGGSDQTGLRPQDTWALSGTTWSAIDTGTTAPAAGSFAPILAEDPAGALLVGADVHRLVGSRWMQVGTSTPSFVAAYDSFTRIASSAYHAARARPTIVMGDRRTRIVGDFEVVDGSVVEVNRVGAGPPAGSRPADALAYDAANARLVHVGGLDRDDMWVGSAGSWSRVTGGRTPIDHLRSSFTAMDDGALLFVAESSWEGPARETWRWDTNGWRTESRPGPRASGPMAYDSVRDRVVMFGGFHWTSREPVAETWTWDDTAWTRQPIGGPPALRSGSFLFDTSAGESILVAAGTWAFDGTSWSNRGASVTPRTWAGMAYEEARSRIVLFGGFDTNGPLDDFYERTGAGWSALPSGPPAMRSPTLFYDASTAQTALLGEPTTNLWSYDGAAWTEWPLRPRGILHGIQPKLGAGPYHVAAGPEGPILFGGPSLDGRYDIYWQVDPRATAKPSVLLSFAGIDGPNGAPIDTVVLRGVAGGTGEAGTGVRVFAWNVTTGEWMEVSSGPGSADAAAPFEAQISAGGSYRTESGEVFVMIRPMHGQGASSTATEVTVDDVELSVTFRVD